MLKKVIQIDMKRRMSIDFPRRTVLGFLEISHLFDTRDRKELETFVEFVFETPDCLRRSNLAGHLTPGTRTRSPRSIHNLAIRALGR